jgi:hypothetical protein
VAVSFLLDVRSPVGASFEGSGGSWWMVFKSLMRVCGCGDRVGVWLVGVVGAQEMEWHGRGRCCVSIGCVHPTIGRAMDVGTEAMGCQLETPCTRNE